MSESYHNNPIGGGEHVREQLSDYMDGLLSGDEREAVRAHLDRCAECLADHVELRATQKLMQNLPAVMAPRAFTLTPEMARQVRKPSFWDSVFVPRNAPGLATGSIVAFVLLIVVLAGTNGLSFSIVGGAALTVSSNPAGGPEQSSLKSVTEATATPAAVAQEEPRISGSAGSTTTGGTEPPPAQAAMPTQPAPGSLNPAHAEGTSTGTAAQDGNGAVVTPNTTVANSGTGSPTTTTLAAPALPSSDGTISHDKFHSSPETLDKNPALPSGENSRTGWIALQLGLLAVGLALAAAALIAWRRT